MTPRSTLSAIGLAAAALFGCRSEGSAPGAPDAAAAPVVDDGSSSAPLPACTPRPGRWTPSAFLAPVAFASDGGCADIDQAILVVDCRVATSDSPAADERCRELLAGTSVDAGAAIGACMRCLIGEEGPGATTPLVTAGPLVRLNVSGCLATLLPPSRPGEQPGCPDVTRLQACVAEVCSSCRGSLADHLSCASLASAADGPCAGEQTAARRCSANFMEPGQLAAVCNPSGEFAQAARAYGTRFCVPSADAGGR